MGLSLTVPEFGVVKLSNGVVIKNTDKRKIKICIEAPKEVNIMRVKPTNIEDLLAKYNNENPREFCLSLIQQTPGLSIADFDYLMGRITNEHN